MTGPHVAATASTRPAPPNARSDVSVVEIGHEGVLYDDRSGRAHRLNAPALLVWRCCDGTLTSDEIVSEIAASFSEPSDVVAQHVAAAIAEFADAGLLAGAVGRAPQERGEPVGPVGDVAQPPTGVPLRRLGPYRALDLRIVVDVHESAEIADELDRVLAPLAAADGEGPTDAQTFVVWHDEGWRLAAGGNRFHAADASVIADFVLWQINWLAFENSPRCLVLHAAAVARDGLAVVLPATANSGKSTLATALVAAGFDYLSDEAAAIDLDTGEVLAHPKPITLDPGTQALFPGLDPSRLAGKSTKWYVAPDAIRPDCVVERARLAHLVFPTYQPGADNRLVPIDTIDAVVEVIGHAFNLAEHADRLADIVALIEGCTLHRLRHDGVDAPVAAIESLVGPVA